MFEFYEHYAAEADIERVFSFCRSEYFVKNYLKNSERNKPTQITESQEIETFAAIPHISRFGKEGKIDGQDYHFITRTQFEADVLPKKFSNTMHILELP